ncbi:helix-turn-helix domain-containing protein [Actinomadura flavalba]|uniref:helix-turn-helix domain-containing protein n=1 Tax=Actinomadura flavalba TaxID=1120938 RepID=UPI0003797F89|nr:helix-turn-helix transcriptional regulator [Actinomadura flavalba]
MSDDASSPGLFAERLEYLFQTRNPEGEKKLTYQRVADAINQAAGEQVISQAYVHQLRRGVKTNPTYKHIQALARYFGVPEQFFFDAPDTTETDAVRALAIKADGLSDDTLRAITTMIEQARSLEGLPAHPTEPRNV